MRQLVEMNMESDWQVIAYKQQTITKQPIVIQMTVTKVNVLCMCTKKIVKKKGLITDCCKIICGVKKNRCLNGIEETSLLISCLKVL